MKAGRIERLEAQRARIWSAHAAHQHLDRQQPHTHDFVALLCGCLPATVSVEHRTHGVLREPGLGGQERAQGRHPTEQLHLRRTGQPAIRHTPLQLNPFFFRVLLLFFFFPSSFFLQLLVRQGEANDAKLKYSFKVRIPERVFELQTTSRIEQEEWVRLLCAEVSFSLFSLSLSFFLFLFFFP